MATDMTTLFPASKIEEMKEQGISEHLVKLVSMNPDAYNILVGRNIENGTIYKHFLADTSSDSLPDFRYASAAKLISKADADLLNKFQKELEESEKSDTPEIQPEDEPPTQ